MKVTTITLKLTDEQNDFFEKHAINKSAFIRKIIDEEIERMNKK